jgi:sarcosine oxidase delta subunit
MFWERGCADGEMWGHDKVMDTYYYMTRHTVKTLFCSCCDVANANEFKSTLN